MLILERGELVAKIVKVEVNFGSKGWPDVRERWRARYYRAIPSKNYIVPDGEGLAYGTEQACREKVAEEGVKITEEDIGYMTRYFTPHEIELGALKFIADL